MEQSLIWTGFLASLAAGVMLAASAFSLIVPGLEAASASYGGALPAALTVGGGIMLGAIALGLINLYVPHEHFILRREGVMSTSLRRIWLFVIAITLHNFPEGSRSASAMVLATSTRRARSPSASACRTCPRVSPWRSRRRPVRGPARNNPARPALV